MDHTHMGLMRYNWEDLAPGHGESSESEEPDEDETFEEHDTNTNAQSLGEAVHSQLDSRPENDV